METGLRGWFVVMSAGTAACGRFDFAVRVDAGAPRSCNLAVPGASSLIDDFADGVLAPNWYSGGSCIVESAGALVAAPAANTTTSYCLGYTTAFYRLDCDQFTVHVPE